MSKTDTTEAHNGAHDAQPTAASRPAAGPSQGGAAPSGGSAPCEAGERGGFTAPQTVTVTLEAPIARGKTAITTVQLRKPKAGELRGLLLTDLLQMKVDALALLLPRISTPTLTKPEIDALDPVDLIALGGEAIGFFLSKGQKAHSAESPNE